MINILIPAFLMFCLYKTKFNRNGFYSDNLSYNNTNMMKGLFALSIILCHLSEMQDVESFCFFRGTGNLAVSMFFFMSGYGLRCSYEKHGLKNFFTKRISTVLIPFVFIQFLSFILYSYLPGVQGLTAETYSVKNLLLKFLRNGTTLTVNAWYVYEILIVYLEFWVAYKIGGENRKKVGDVLIVLFTLMTTIFFGVLTHNTEWLQFWAYSLPAFALGVVWSVDKEKIEKRLRKHYYINLFAFIALTVLFFYSNKIFDKMMFLQVYNINTTFLSRYLTSPFFVVTVMLVSMKFKSENVLLGKLGDISYELYLYHGFVYCLLRSVTFAYVENDTLYAILIILVSIDISIVMRFVSQKITKALINKQSEVKI